MTELNCNVRTCCHNDENCCCLNSIDVKGESACNCDDTCCNSYNGSSGASNSTDSPNINLSIDCNATNCIYNKAQKCEAKHVDISGICASEKCETVCSTFKSR